MALLEYTAGKGLYALASIPRPFYDALTRIAGARIDVFGKHSKASITDRFEQRAMDRPNDVAVKTDSGQISYGELNRKANY